MASTINASTTGGGGIISSADSSGVLQLQTAGTTAVTVDASQNVGIGTASPAAAGAGYINLTVNGSTSGFVDVKNTTVTGRFQANASDFAVNVTGAYPLTFLTSNTERMRIDSSGNLLIGATSRASGVVGIVYINGTLSAASYQARAGAIGAYTGNSYNINWTGTPQLWIDNTNIGTFAFTSDYRIKKNIVTNATPALERIAQVRPVTYEFANYGELFKEDGVQREGFIAHELQAVIPSAVEGKKDAEDQIQSLKLDALCSVMVKAIQELKAIVDTQAEQIKALQGASV